jgi:hypothetical protein
MNKLPSISTLVPNVSTGIILSITGIISWKLILLLQLIAYAILPTLVEQAAVVIGALAIFYYATIAFQRVNEIASRSVGSVISTKASSTSAEPSSPADQA